MNSKILKSKIETIDQLNSLVREHITKFPLTVIDNKEKRIMDFQNLDSLLKYLNNYKSLLDGFIVFAKNNNDYQLLNSNVVVLTFKQ